MNDASSKPAHATPALASPEELSRRKLFQRISLIVGGITGAGLVTPLLGFVLAPLAQRKPEVWRTVGKVDDFAIGQTVAVRYEDPSALPWAGVTARTAAWLRRQDTATFIAFTVHCSHLGCPVRWLAQANLFLCPCHGGVFYANGDVAAGPPGYALARYPVRVKEGEVQIQTAPLPILKK